MTFRPFIRKIKETNNIGDAVRCIAEGAYHEKKSNCRKLENEHASK